jgi:hypothetical protein
VLREFGRCPSIPEVLFKKKQFIDSWASLSQGRTDDQNSGGWWNFARKTAGITTESPRRGVRRGDNTRMWKIDIQTVRRIV